MLRSAIPTRFQLPWAKNAGGPFIRTVPVASQIGIQDGAASYNDGFPPDCFTPIAAGGVPPFGQDINGVMNATTSWDQWYQAGAAIPYDATFATAIGGYPQGAVLDSAIVLGTQWFSWSDNNLTNPDDPLTSVNWFRVGVQVGMPVPFLTTVLPYGFVPMNSTTIGNVASGANYADASLIFLFAFNWPNVLLPILDSSGTVTTRGANAFADFAANKRLTNYDMRGHGLIGVDTMGGSPTANLSGVPIPAGNSTFPGSFGGQNLHALSAGELAGHSHNGSGTTGNDSPDHVHASDGRTAFFPGGASSAGISSAGVAASISAASLNSAGASARHAHGYSFTTDNGNGLFGGGHNTVSLSTLVYWGQKL